MMASHTPNFGRASALPLSAVLASLPSYPRPVIECLVERMIDRLDKEDGDLDVELNGDELDFNQAEDDFQNYGHLYGDGCGCPVSDPGEDTDPPEMDEHGTCADYGDDQRIAWARYCQPWHIDKEMHV